MFKDKEKYYGVQPLASKEQLDRLTELLLRKPSGHLHDSNCHCRRCRPNERPCNCNECQEKS